MSLGVAIVGCGLIGRKRAAALAGARLVACADVQRDRAEALARTAPGASASDDWRVAVRHPGADIVIVATTNDQLAPIAAAALAEGKHVLVEKPAARSVAELDTVIDAAERHQRLVHVGFNHRYHPALVKAREIATAPGFGELMFLRGRYGHGGRVGYDREWRADPARAGGGELIDQGVHLIDLSRWFLGSLSLAHGLAGTYFWDMAVDDNAFLTLQTPQRQVAFLHVSCTEWKNLFCLEIYGRHGKLQIDGLGGSYGVERLTFYRMLPEMGPPDTMSWEFPGADTSWNIEFAEFLDDIRLGRRPAASLDDARATLDIVGQVYDRSRQ